MRAAHREELAEAHFTAVRTRVRAKLETVPWWRSRWLRAAAVGAVACAVLWLAMMNWSVHKPEPPPQVAFARPPVPAMAPGLPLRNLLPYGRRSERGRARQLAEERKQAAAVLSRPALLPVRRRPAPSDEESLTVRIVTDDPDIVIYWITNPKGE